jgi:GR25 family glycosyltransferase involved in LPS biosynthesis
MKTFIISLSKIDISIKNAIELQSNLKNFNINAQLFEGTYGNDAIKIFNKENRIAAPIIFKNKLIPAEKTNLPGAMGCFYSHLRLWNKCVNLNEPIIIFEDDVIIVRKFVPVKWTDVLILATSWHGLAKRYYKYLEFSNEEPKAVEYHYNCVPGTAGYAITPEAARKLLKKYKNSYTLADHAINKDIVNIEIHNKLMGKSKTISEGNFSLVDTDLWNN